MSDSTNNSDLLNKVDGEDHKFEVSVVTLLWAHGFHVLSSTDALECINMLCSVVNASEVHHAMGDKKNESQ